MLRRGGGGSRRPLRVFSLGRRPARQASGSGCVLLYFTLNVFQTLVALRYPVEAGEVVRSRYVPLFVAL